MSGIVNYVLENIYINGCTMSGNINGTNVLGGIISISRFGTANITNSVVN